MIKKQDAVSKNDVFTPKTQGANKRKESQETFSLGIDIGSTTFKIVVWNSSGQLVFSDYRRHNANIRQTARDVAVALYGKFGNCKLNIVITGSVGMGYADRLHLHFVQEVVASAEFIKSRYPDVSTFVDIGGEDSKMIFFEKDKVPDIRMNGSCAGGTGAFIDQTATLLGVAPQELDRLASKAETIYPIASRCGVFSKTDIQNLTARNVSRSDIAASVFNAVALQVVSSLARGTDILPKIFFCGGPFAFLPELKKSFMRVLQLDDDKCVFPENAQLIPASGCALLAQDVHDSSFTLLEILALLRLGKEPTDLNYEGRLPALFEQDKEYDKWIESKKGHNVPRAALNTDKPINCYLGVDSGSTTTKIVLLDEDGNIVYQDYRRNKGDNFHTFGEALNTLTDAADFPENICIAGSAVTGYGENLLKTAFNLDFGIVETMAHFSAAKQVTPKVSFVLDIGGQDMKAIFVENGYIRRIEINEACSSGCGSFIETFANMLGYKVENFAEMSCHAQHPCDLGTRCTVFMNSRVKQAMREGAAVEDIAAGFSYSVVKNCLFKVLKLSNIKELGKHIVVQGGTFKNHSIVRALELLTGCEVSYSDIPELMGAYGAALYAKNMAHQGKGVKLLDMMHVNSYQSEFETCPGCENHCTVKVFKFQNGNSYYSGNNCEKIYSNRSEDAAQGVNMFAEKNKLLFARTAKGLAILPAIKNEPTIGIPRGLGMYENFPFWHTLFSACGFKVVLSHPSSNKLYDSGIRTIMADNICFPAKLMHGHVRDLVERKVDRIFYPYVVYERKEDERSGNSYNCPVVAGYSDVLKSAMDTARNNNIPFDAPVVSFNDETLLKRSCTTYLQSLGVAKNIIGKAIDMAVSAQNTYLQTLTNRAEEVLAEAEKSGRMVILLAARPYHSDPLIEHKIAQTIADMGIDVITENVATQAGAEVYDELNAVSQWAYPNRIFKAAHFAGKYCGNLHFVELTSFGCGPDAFILDEVNHILHRYGKNLTILKIDDVNNTGSLRLRIRSLVECVKMQGYMQSAVKQPRITTKTFEVEDKKRTLLAPYFAEGYSEFIPSVFKLAGYEIVTLPTGNQEAAETGLKYANNDVCYPATIVVGSIMNALQSGKYDLANTAVIMTQTGGQCRASNYLSLIKNALVSAGYKDVPVISLATGAGIDNNQPGFVVNWGKMAKITIYTVLFADCLSKLYHSAVVREFTPGMAAKLRTQYTEAACAMIEKRNYNGILSLLRQAVSDFMAAIDVKKRVPIIGVVGEIYVKYNGFSNKYVINWLNEQGVEVVAPSIYNFFIAAIANKHINRKENIKKESLPLWLTDGMYGWVKKHVRKFDDACKQYPFYTPFTDVFADAQLASKIVNLAGNFGEGWLIPAELSNLAAHGVNNVVSLQPFGCIANHIISKGIEKRVKQIFPQMSLLFLDFDSSTSDANVFNRLHFLVENAKQQIKD